jgi:transcriptional regulator with XRE-family HTH domain
MTMIKQGFGAEIRRLRIENGLTLEALAHDADMGLTFLKEIEAGQKQASITTLFKLAFALSVAPDVLIVPTYNKWVTDKKKS